MGSKTSYWRCIYKGAQELKIGYVYCAKNEGDGLIFIELPGQSGKHPFKKEWFEKVC